MALRSKTATDAGMPGLDAAGQPLDHDTLRQLPAGYADPASEFYVEPGDRARYGRIATREARTLAATVAGYMGQTRTDERGRLLPEPTPEQRRHGLIADKVAQDRAADERQAETSRREAEAARCAVCGKSPGGGDGANADTPELTDLWAVDPATADVRRYGFGSTGDVLRLHAPCAVVLADELRKRVEVDAAARAGAATLAAALLP